MMLFPVDNIFNINTRIKIHVKNLNSLGVFFIFLNHQISRNLRLVTLTVTMRDKSTVEAPASSGRIFWPLLPIN